jgi:hypothetical protein
LAIGNIIPKEGTKVYINIAPIIVYLPLVTGCGTIPPLEEIARHFILSKITKNLTGQKGLIVFVSSTLQQSHGLFSAIFQ